MLCFLNWDGLIDYIRCVREEFQAHAREKKAVLFFVGMVLCFSIRSSHRVGVELGFVVWV